MTEASKITNKPLLDEFYVRTAFKKELGAITDPTIVKIAVEMLRRAHIRYFTGPSSSSGKYHPRTEFFSGPKGDITGAPPNRGKEYGGQVLHCRRVFKIGRHLLKAHMINEEESNIAKAAFLVHDIAQYEDGKAGTVRFHEALVGELTKDVPMIDPSLTQKWQQIIRLCEVHSGQWGKDDTYYPVTELEKIVHDADYLASRISTGEIDVEHDDWSR